MIIIKWPQKGNKQTTDSFVRVKGNAVARFVGSIVVTVRREVINLFSYIKKTSVECSSAIRSTDLDSGIAKTRAQSSFLKKAMSLTSAIDREVIS